MVLNASHNSYLDLDVPSNCYLWAIRLVLQQHPSLLYTLSFLHYQLPAELWREHIIQVLLLEKRI